mgnify:FL=1
MSSSLHTHLNELTQALIDHPQAGDDGILNKISRASRISPDLALEIYRNNTRAARVRALEIVYPACQSILGENTFRSIANGYVTADVKGASDLNRYGEAFDKYLGVIIETGRLPAGYVYLQDLARLEYRYHAAYYADADPLFDFGLFERRVKSGGQVYFQLSASIGLLDTQYPVYEIWQLNRAVQDARRSVAKNHEVQAVSEMQYLLVHRESDKPVVTPIGDRQYRLLEAIGNHRSLQSVIEHIVDDIEVLVPGMIANRWIVGVRRDE